MSEPRKTRCSKRAGEARTFVDALNVREKRTSNIGPDAKKRGSVKIDLLYLCHGRLEFTKKTLTTLVENTDWSMVDNFVVYNDAAPDLHETTKFLKLGGAPEWADVRLTNLASPVGVMKHFIHRSECDVFAKIDNDIMCPPGWLNAMAGVMEANEDLELLGMEAGRPEALAQEGDCAWTVTEASHIGGVGLMRRSAFEGRKLNADGRFGFTEFQHHHLPTRGWITPDLRVFSLDQIPFNPWRGYTMEYLGEENLQRDWPCYPDDMERHWAWANLEQES